MILINCEIKAKKIKELIAIKIIKMVTHIWTISNKWKNKRNLKNLKKK
jgi:hypothetical protein